MLSQRGLQHYLGGCGLFIRVLGDVLSAKTFDCVCALRKTKRYKGRLKQVTERVEKQRRLYEYNSAKNIPDIYKFADACQQTDDESERLFIQLKSSIKIANNTEKDVDANILSLLLCALFFAEAISEVKEFVVNEICKKGMYFKHFNVEPDTLRKPIQNLALTYLGKNANATIEQISNNDTVLMAKKQIVGTFCRDGLIFLTRISKTAECL